MAGFVEWYHTSYEKNVNLMNMIYSTYTLTNRFYVAINIMFIIIKFIIYLVYLNLNWIKKGKMILLIQQKKRRKVINLVKYLHFFLKIPAKTVNISIIFFYQIKKVIDL